MFIGSRHWNLDIFGHEEVHYAADHTRVGVVDIICQWYFSTNFKAWSQRQQKPPTAVVSHSRETQVKLMSEIPKDKWIRASELRNIMWYFLHCTVIICLLVCLIKLRTLLRDPPISFKSFAISDSSQCPTTNNPSVKFS